MKVRHGKKKDPQIKIDCSISVKPLGKYLLKVVTTKHRRDQTIESVKTAYPVQWQNIKADAKNFFKNPFGVAPNVALSLLVPLVFLFSEEKAFYLFFIGSLTLDSATEGNNVDSFNVTVAVNDDRVLILGIGHYQNGNGISGATYDSDALSEIFTQDGSFGEHAALWGLIAPNTGTNSLAISGRDSWMGFGAISVYDANQSALPTNVDGNSASGSSNSIAITTTVDNAWVVAAAGGEPAITMETTDGVEDMNLEGQSFEHAEMHHVAKATAGSQTMEVSLSYGARSNIAACELEPAGGAPATAVKDIIGSGVIPAPR